MWITYSAFKFFLNLNFAIPARVVTIALTKSVMSCVSLLLIKKRNAETHIFFNLVDDSFLPRSQQKNEITQTEKGVKITLPFVKLADNGVIFCSPCAIVYHA